MKIRLIFTGKTASSYLKDGISIYEKRLSHYVPFELVTIDISKKTHSLKNSLAQKQYESESLLKLIKPNDYLILLDEKGREFNSVQFSQTLQKLLVSLQSNIVFVVGGAYGFDEKVYKRANMLLSLSKMTCSHQLIRLFFLEQLYRAMTIIRNEPYHHE
jgi:23S rRNA (pseudouridine1915-N3)-methyltransferase